MPHWSEPKPNGSLLHKPNAPPWPQPERKPSAWLRSRLKPRAWPRRRWRPGALPKPMRSASVWLRWRWPLNRPALAEAKRQAVAEAVRQRAAADAAAPPTPSAAKSANQTLVLVADDSKVVRIKTGRLLAQHQYQVSYANDGLDAVQQLQAGRPDVVITDVEMPGMDGFELTRHIRGNPKTAHLPVIMITAADDRHREQAEQAGVSVLLGKPYPEDALIAHIRLAMGQGEPLAPAAGTTAAIAQSTPWPD